MLIQGSNLDVDEQDAEYQQVVESIKGAMVIVSTVPILCIYPFLQKYFVGGIMIGSLKGRSNPLKNLTKLEIVKNASWL